MFLKTSLGPKEGRLPPGLLSPISSDRRRRASHCQVHGILIGLVVLLLFVYEIWFKSRVLAHFEEQSRNVPGLPDLRGSISSKQSTAWSRVGSLRRIKTPDTQKPLGGEPEHDKSNKKEYLTKETSKQGTDNKNAEAKSEEGSSYSTEWTKRPDFEHNLNTVIDLLPDEVNMRELLRPIDAGGEMRMRELGLRTRAYQKYFGAWEKLHLGTNEKTGEIYIQDDVIQYLQGTQGEASRDPSLATTVHGYESFRAFMTTFARMLFPFTAPYFSDHMTLHAQIKNGGRGIVLTAGDNQARYLLTTIYTFRKLGCDLPIEVMYLGDSDLGEDHRLELEDLPGVTTRDISQMVDDAGWSLAGWAAKPYAILLSSFREVIFIDADSLFFQNPATLFDDPDYVETGALFFRDRMIMPESKRRWLQQVLPRPIPKIVKESRWWTGQSGHQQESGVVVVDKWKHFVAMLLVCRFNGSDRDTRDGKTGVYEMMYGDKETFWIGFLLAGDSSFAFHKGPVGILGTVKPPKQDPAELASDSPTPALDDEEPPTPTPTAAAAPTPDAYTICAPQLLHLGSDGRPLWFNGWLLANKFAKGSNRRFATMQSFLVEPKTAPDGDIWELTGDNICCLTSDADSKFDFSDRDAEVLKMIMERATEVGMSN
ncbi:glycosyltransferase family 71 protein [Xylariaceae sp. FL1651]|nr:glycosyltransferase family 71 protein [Xylariaceae sp. FL1651]